jgi:phosphatidylglycerol:prolipoprotein diacylglycerol transferase
MLAFITYHPHPFLVEFADGWGIRYYGLAYAAGFLFLYWGLRYQVRRGWLQLSFAQIDDFVFWVAFGGVVLGGRLGYCLFYDLQGTLHDPLRFFRVWEGGMASHGGILGVIVVMMVMARRMHKPFYHLADAAAWCTPIGLGLGRVANFLNGELWGRPTQVPWGMIFPEAGSSPVPRHPSQLYEAVLEGLVLWLILNFVRRRGTHDGAVALTFMAAYPVLRIVGECFREPDAPIGYFFGAITEGQLLSFAMIVVVIFLEYQRRKNNIHRIRVKEGASPYAP